MITKMIDKYLTDRFIRSLLNDVIYCKNVNVIIEWNKKDVNVKCKIKGQSIYSSVLSFEYHNIFNYMFHYEEVVRKVSNRINTL